jgi:hypothetical protein
VGKSKIDSQIRVKNKRRVTAGEISGKIRANAEAKIMARIQHARAYEGSYVPG